MDLCLVLAVGIDIILLEPKARSHLGHRDQGGFFAISMSLFMISSAPSTLLALDEGLTANTAYGTYPTGTPSNCTQDIL